MTFEENEKKSIKKKKKLTKNEREKNQRRLGPFIRILSNFLFIITEG